MTIWPSWKPTDISRPAIWVLTVTVASGVTAPSALMVIGMSPSDGGDGAHRSAAAGRTAGVGATRPASNPDLLELEAERDQSGGEREQKRDPAQAIALAARRRRSATGAGSATSQGAGIDRFVHALVSMFSSAHRTMRTH